MQERICNAIVKFETNDNCILLYVKQSFIFACDVAGTHQKTFVFLCVFLTTSLATVKSGIFSNIFRFKGKNSKAKKLTSSLDKIQGIAFNLSKKLNVFHCWKFVTKLIIWLYLTIALLPNFCFYHYLTYYFSGKTEAANESCSGKKCS